MNNWKYYSTNYIPKVDMVTASELYKMSLENYGEFWLRMRIRGHLLGRKLIHHSEITP